MTSMPTIDDRMVGLFRRTGKRRGSYRPAQSVRSVPATQRAVLQGSDFCRRHPGAPCRDVNGAPGKCWGGICMTFPFDGFDL